MALSLKQTSFWRTLRGLKRAILAPRVDALLTSGQRRATITWQDAPIALEAGATFTAKLKLENASDVAWTANGTQPVSLRCKWESYRGEAFAEATSEHSLDGPLFPGEPREITLTLKAPDFVGDFVAVIDFVQHGEAFAESNPESHPARIAIPVQGRRETDIDYHQVFRSANLGENHWWVVGAYKTREQYERSSRERLAMLVQHGITRTSRILDVGCGTGQMAGVLAEYLAPTGVYCGTDIGREAIEFCQTNFRRPGFTFRQGEMTRIPFEASHGPFDAAVYFSVFTHTFPDETGLLLTATRRLLADQGFIIADVIVSKLVERAAGHRGEMILNREHFFLLADAAGLTGDVLGRWDWNRHAERILVRFRRSE